VVSVPAAYARLSHYIPGDATELIPVWRVLDTNGLAGRPRLWHFCMKYSRASFPEFILLQTGGVADGNFISQFLVCHVSYRPFTLLVGF